MSKGNKDRGGIIVLVLYAVLFLVITYFHEPWFDEAQAWEIGRTATFREMLTVLPHTEGHPPLWSLILSIPAKLGIPYLIGLKGVSFIISMLIVALIVFKSPFPKIIKYMLPFTYFIFYQYGVISRTYCVLELACVLIAITYRKRNIKPWRFVGSLYLLCLTSAYGILIAGGICLCWVWDIVKEMMSGEEKRLRLTDKRIISLITLFAGTLILVYLIVPYQNTAAVQGNHFSGIFVKLFYFLFVMTGDAFTSAGGIPVWSQIGPEDMIPGFVSTIIIYLYIWFVSKKNEIKYYCIPMLLFFLFSVYYAVDHHMGICVLWVMCYSWCVYDDSFIKDRISHISDTLINKTKDLKKERVEGFLRIIPIVFLAIMIFYSLETSVRDIMLPYSESAEIAKFIKDHNMVNADIMIQWEPDVRTVIEDMSKPDVDRYESDNTYDAVAILPYFDDNIFFNHNVRDHRKGYATHLKHSREENIATYKLWEEHGIPEVLVGTPLLGLVYDGESFGSSMGDYVSVASMTGYYVGKNSLPTVTSHIYVRKDCLDKFGLGNGSSNR